MNDLSNAAAHSLSRTRDGAASSVFEVRFTNAADYVVDLRKDFEAGIVEDNIVRLAIVNAPATIEQCEGKWSAGGHRNNPWFRSKYVTSSYQARGQLMHLSVYCGVSYVWKDENEACIAVTKATAVVIMEEMRKVQAALSKMPGLDLRSGAVYVQQDSDPWLAAFLSPIEAPPVVSCAICSEEIYYANERWRHKSTGREEVNEAVPGRNGRTIQKLHHVASPDWEEGS